MRIKEILGAASAFALTSVPALAQAVDRAAEASSDANGIAGMSTLLVIALVVALGVGIFLIVDDGNSDSP